MRDFEKLDHFMREHKPALKAPSEIPRIGKIRLVPWLSVGVAAATILFFIVSPIIQEPLYMESVFIAESIEWETEEDSLLSYYDVL